MTRGNKKSYTEKHVSERYGNKYYSNKDLRQEGLDAIEKLQKSTSFSGNIDYTPYTNRSRQRYDVVVNFFSDYLKGAILDVGSRNNSLAEISNKNVALVDKNNPDLPEWNWEIEKLPYSARSFDTVVCLDVLEHVDNFHEAFNDLLRVSEKYVIISLPNNWKKALNEFIKGRGRWEGYGLPPEKLLDRHKWFFNTEDAENFIYYHSASSLQNYTIKRVLYHIPKTITRIKITHPILKFILPERHFKNLFVETVFFVLEKKT